MDYPKFIVLNQKEESISIQRVKGCWFIWHTCKTDCSNKHAKLHSGTTGSLPPSSVGGYIVYVVLESSGEMCRLGCSMLCAKF